MLDMGFIRDIERIIALLPKERQNIGLSATITPKIEQILHKILIHPVMVSVRTRNISEHVHQDVIRAHTNEDKITLLRKLLTDIRGEKVLIFGRTKHGVQKLARTLTKEGFRATDIHGNRSQPQRQRALKDFRNGKVSIMVATDVAARGLDIPNVAYVINYDEPNTYDDYIHRIGRTGRAGKSGKALTFVKA
jgi:ATP-dependent RNA helicase RhlE